jgi:hypothetical protein
MNFQSGPRTGLGQPGSISKMSLQKGLAPQHFCTTNQSNAIIMPCSPQKIFGSSADLRGLNPAGLAPPVSKTMR